MDTTTTATVTAAPTVTPGLTAMFTHNGTAYLSTVTPDNAPAYLAARMGSLPFATMVDFARRAVVELLDKGMTVDAINAGKTKGTAFTFVEIATPDALGF